MTLDEGVDAHLLFGVALIGLSAGQSIAWWGRDGKGHRMTVLAVEPAMAMAG